ncbi:hypothetical protein RND81_12G187400 [Saponaria officinalis]|uniref:Uncharacterized protein n=1 Tax=Saponaria officinalis TaxID=3572 RepID=A0AAW1HCK6_SAPOF
MAGGDFTVREIIHNPLLMEHFSSPSNHNSLLITLFSSPLIGPQKLEPLLNSFSSKQDPIHLTFSSIGLLPNHNNLLFLSHIPTFSLLNFHSQLCDLLKKEGVDVGDDFGVDSWIPASPVAMDVPKSRLSEAVTVLRDLKLPVSGYAMDVGVVEFSPVRELYSFMLGNFVDC